MRARGLPGWFALACGAVVAGACAVSFNDYVEGASAGAGGAGGAGANSAHASSSRATSSSASTHSGGSTTGTAGSASTGGGHGGAGGTSSTTTSAAEGGGGTSSGGGGGCPDCDCDLDGHGALGCDGSGGAADDCADGDDRAHPGQTTPFGTPITGPRQTGTPPFDFDCDGAETYTFTELVDCTGSPPCSATVGWVGSVPACGETGMTAHCQSQLLNCTQVLDGSRVQTCL